MQNLTSIIKNFQNKKVLVIGDVMADVYLWGNVGRISPEAPVQIVNVDRETILPGGAANLANNIVALWGCSVVIGYVGVDNMASDLLDNMRGQDIDCSGIISLQNKPTIRKTRVMGQNQQLLRLDYEDSTPVDESGVSQMLQNFNKQISKADVVVISDYDKGTLPAELISGLITIAKEHDKAVIVDSKKANIDLFKGCDLITPNHKEACAITGIAGDSNDDIVQMGSLLCTRLKTNVLITRASEGMSLFKKDGGVLHFPTEAREVFDVSGAGDTVVAAIALCLCAGSSYEDAILVANQAAAIQVGKVGTATVTQKELLKKIEDEQAKVKSQAEINDLVKQIKSGGQKVVFTNGCFDLLHPGHLKYLKKAAGLADVLVVAINSDSSVKKLKGEGRPIINQEQRAEMLSLLDFVDYITFFDEDTPEKIIGLIKPDIIVKGGDYSVEELPEAKVVASYGGEVAIIPFVEGYSSSRIIEKILQGET